MTPAEMKKKELSRLVKRSNALRKEWDRIKDDESATPAQRVAVLADIHSTATQFYWVKAMTPKQVAKCYAENNA
jgi:hypothetical protein